MTEALPSAVSEPIGRAPDAMSGARGHRRKLIERELGDAPYFARVRSRSRVDVGGWLGRRRVDVFALADEVLLLAADPLVDWGRPFVKRLAFRQLQRSVYNHVTGSLALAGEGGRVHADLAMRPLEAGQLLAQVYQRDSQKG